MKHYADKLWLLCMQQQQQQQQGNSQQIARAELHSLVLQLTPQQRQTLSKMPSDKRIQLFCILHNYIDWARQQQQKGQQASWQQPSGSQQTGLGPMQQPTSTSLAQVCSRADGASIMDETQLR